MNGEKRIQAEKIAIGLAWTLVGVSMLAGLVAALMEWRGVPVEWQALLWILIAGTPVGFMVFAFVLYPLVRLWQRRR
jgi:hypothetical protein